ncbi:MAG: CYTH domain-containing protein [Rhodanobacter sp.]
MATEIERKFLVRDASWRAAVEHSEPMRQGYLLGTRVGAAGEPARASVRVRIAGSKAWLNIKQAIPGIARAEFEYAIPLADAETMLATLCGTLVQKTRHHVRVDGTLFEIDEFAADNAGLIVAEVELPAIDAPFPKPAWLGLEVSALRRYYNVSLIEHPYRQWSAVEKSAGDVTC